MEGFHHMSRSIGKTLNAAGGILLTAMMLLTVSDVILRYLGRPITGTYELMSMAGAVVIGLTIGQTSLDGAHVNVDMLTSLLTGRNLLRKTLILFIRVVGIGVFLLLAWALYLKGNDLVQTREVSLTLRVPIYPVAYVLSFCSLVECMILTGLLLKDLVPGGRTHE